MYNQSHVDNLVTGSHLYPFLEYMDNSNYNVHKSHVEIFVIGLVYSLC